VESAAVTTIVESAREAAAMKAAAAKTTASKAASVEAAATKTAAVETATAAKATAMAASTAKAAATTVAASASTAARQRHRWRNQAQGGNRQQRDQTLAHHNHSPSDIAPNRDTSDVAIVFEIAIAIDAFAAQLFAMPC
jgi:hypothetical protein